MSTLLACLPQHLEIHILTPNYRPINTSKTAALLFTVDILFSKARQRLFADSRLWTADHRAQVPLNNCVRCKSAFHFKTKADYAFLDEAITFTVAMQQWKGVIFDGWIN